MLKDTKTIKEVIKPKKGAYFNEAQEEFISVLSQTDFDMNIVDTVTLGNEAGERPIVYDYIHPSLRKRAMTINAAYLIAVKLWLALNTKHLTLYDFWNNSIFQQKFGDIQKGGIADHAQLYYRVMTLYSFVEMAQDDTKPDWTLRDIADMSISLAWVEAYLKSGFFPKDEAVMIVQSEEHKMLTDEVENILVPTVEYFRQIDIWDKKVILYPTIVSDRYLITGSVDLIVEDYVLHITSRSSLELSKLKADLQELIAYELIRENVEKRCTVHSYYVRFNTLATGTIRERFC